MILTSEQKMNFIDFISQESYQRKHHDTPPEYDYATYFLRFSDLTLTFNGIQCVIKERRSG